MMNIRILLPIIVLFFFFQSIHAQDTVQHSKKHIHKVQSGDSAKLSRANNIKSVPKKKPVVMPKYPRTGYVAVMGALGLPLAAYASNLGAATGSAFSISAAFPGIISHSGIAFKFDHGTNGFNQSRLDGIENNIAGFGNINCTVSEPLGHCSYSSFLAGWYLTYPKKHLTIDLRILAGVMSANIPALTFTYNDETRGTSANFYQGASSASAFAFDLGFELRYPVRRRFCILLSADYLHAVPSFLMVRTGATLSSYGSITQPIDGGQQTTTSQPFNLFNLSIGVGYTISAQKGALKSK